MQRESAIDATRRFVREHERALIVAWLVGLAACLAVCFGWGIYLRGAERVVDAYEARWPRQIDAGAELIRQARFEEAAQHLEALDLAFPAQAVKHRLDVERERLLTLLAQAYVALDKKKRAQAACDRLVAFDPRNWRNHWTQAETALHFGDDDVAKLALGNLLAIHPTYLPAVEARIQLAFDGSAYAQIPPLWRAYADAYRLADLEFAFGGSQVRVEVPSDGRVHRFDVPFALPDGVQGEARLATHGWSVDLREVALSTPARAAIVGGPLIQLLGKEGWSVQGAASPGPGSIAATDRTSCLVREVRGPAEGVARAAFELVAYKACTESLWRMVSISYRNLLLWDELEAMRARTRIGGCLEGGSVFLD